MKPSACPSVHARSRQGFVLIAVLILILLASMVVVSLMFRLRAENTAGAALAASEQGWMAAMSGIEEVMRTIVSAAPGTTAWQEDPRRFRDRWVADDGVNRWYFTVWTGVDEDALRDTRYGVSDEASRLNLNTAHTPDLTRVPGLTPALVQALRDFVDTDSAARSEGGETGTDALFPGTPTIAVRNGPLNTVEELLLVRGFTRSLVLGEDVNINGRLDPNEDDGPETPPIDNGDGHLDSGLSRLFTACSYDLNTDLRGRRRTNINDPKDALPVVELPAAVTNFVTLLREHQIRVSHAAELLEATVKIKDQRGVEVDMPSGVGKAELSVVLDYFTATNLAQLKGLINVNTASSQVLATIPEIDPPLAEAIVSARRSISPERRDTLAWLYQEDVVDAVRFKAIAPRLTTRGLQYSFNVVGFGVPSGHYRVFQVIVDLGGGRPRVAYLRDLTRLGQPFPFDTVQSKEATGG